jgi:hypothetical protein
VTTTTKLHVTAGSEARGVIGGGGCVKAAGAVRYPVEGGTVRRVSGMELSATAGTVQATGAWARRSEKNSLQEIKKTY